MFVIFYSFLSLRSPWLLLAYIIHYIFDFVKGFFEYFIKSFDWMLIERFILSIKARSAYNAEERHLSLGKEL